MIPTSAECEGHCTCPLCTIRRWAHEACEKDIHIELVIQTALLAIGEAYDADIMASMQEMPQETIH